MLVSPTWLANDEFSGTTLGPHEMTYISLVLETWPCQETGDDDGHTMPTVSDSVAALSLLAAQA
jgi:hypothetical protein